jgi:hypothetical protein
MPSPAEPDLHLRLAAGFLPSLIGLFYGFLLRFSLFNLPRERRVVKRD